MRGGYRPGGGRPKGSKDKKKRAPSLPITLKDEGMSPLDIMLSVMRYHWKEAMKDPEAPDVQHLHSANAAAKDAAPYVHSRLTTVQGGPVDKPIRFANQLEDDRDAARRILFVLESAVRRSPAVAVPR